MASLLSCRMHVIPGKLSVSELFFEVPRDYSDPSSEKLRIFAHSVTKYERPIVPPDDDEISKIATKPWLLWLQGGPGRASPRPQASPITNVILERGYQMLYLDQRGTGLSTPITAETLALHGNAQQQADYLKLFRADNIVRDCEAIREVLTRDYPAKLKKWSIYAQSFGGYCAMTYISKYPQGLREAFISGGIPPIGTQPADAYRAIFQHSIKRNKLYYAKFPEDVQVVHELAAFIDAKGGIPMPAGGTLTVQRFLTLGEAFGKSGGLDTVHDIVLRMWSDVREFNTITRPTLSNIEAMGGYDDAVIHGILREQIYNPRGASNWAAEAVGKSLEEYSWISGFSSVSIAEGPNSPPLYFSGGMVFPFMFETFAELRKIKEVAHILAQYQEWPDLYDEQQLERNAVPVYVAKFVDDACVDFEWGQGVIKKLKNCKQFITNTMYHDAVRVRTGDLMKELFALRDDVMD